MVKPPYPTITCLFVIEKPPFHTARKIWKDAARQCAWDMVHCHVVLHYCYVQHVASFETWHNFCDEA